MQALEQRSDEELLREQKFRAAAQAILGARAAERYDAPAARAHFQKAIAAARPQERMQLRRMADASLALAERRPDDLKQAVERLGQAPPTGRQLFLLRIMGLLAPAPGASLAVRARGIVILLAIVVLLVLLGWGIVELDRAALRRRRAPSAGCCWASSPSRSCSGCSPSSGAAASSGPGHGPPRADGPPRPLGPRVVCGRYTHGHARPRPGAHALRPGRARGAAPALQRRPHRRRGRGHHRPRGATARRRAALGARAVLGRRPEDRLAHDQRARRGRRGEARRSATPSPRGAA